MTRVAAKRKPVMTVVTGRWSRDIRENKEKATLVNKYNASSEKTPETRGKQEVTRPNRSRSQQVDRETREPVLAGVVAAGHMLQGAVGVQLRRDQQLLAGRVVLRQRVRDAV